MTCLARLGRDRSGVAMVEFAMSLPLLLMVGLGALDTGRYIAANLRCTQIAAAVADNAARVRQALDEADVNEVMIGGKLMGENIDFRNKGRIILSDLERRTTTAGSGGNTLRQWIRWQRCAGALGQASSYGGPISSTGAAVTNLDDTTNSDHGAAENVSKIDGMGPAGHQIAAAPNTAVMVVEVFYQFEPVSLYVPFTSDMLKIHVTEAFNIRQRTDFSIYNANHLGSPNRSDCRQFGAAIPA